MTPDANIFYTLLTSLPAMPADFRQPHLPISRPRLEDRLSMLDRDSLAFVDLLFSLMAFDTSAAEHCDPERQVLFEKIHEAMPDQAIRRQIDFLIDSWDIAAALRARQHKKQPPLMLGQYAGHIRRFWQHPQFNLGLRFTWINTVVQLLKNDRIVQAENEIYQAVWQMVRQQTEQHYFSMSALITYLIQWHLISRWSARDEKTGAKRFTSLLAEAIDGYDTLFEIAPAA